MNQLTLPESIAHAVRKTKYSEVEVNKGGTVLTPLGIQTADTARLKLTDLSIDEQDDTDALHYARKS